MGSYDLSSQPDQTVATSASSVDDARPSASPAMKLFMRISGVLAMALFLLPTFYVLKYYLCDAARENAIVERIAPDDTRPHHGSVNLAAKWQAIDARLASDPDYLPLLQAVAQYDASKALRLAAVGQLGDVMSRTSVSFARPLETVKAKSALAAIAESESDPSVKQAAQAALGKIAQNGVVVQR